MAKDLHLRPLQPVRRFDVFAETKRLEALAHGAEDDVAKGYGIRIAKIVASKRYGGPPKSSETAGKPKSASKTSAADRFGGDDGAKFRALNGELQTDETFDQEIVARMGTEFYDQVFQPSIQQALSDGQKYEQIRDAIRKEWKPVRA